MPAPLRVIAYCRVSSAGQEVHGTSLDVQREEIERYCAARGYPKPTVHVETESGGGEKEEARVVQREVMRLARAGDLVIVSKQDRWSRDVLHMLGSVRKLLSVGANFFALAEGFDPSTSAGEFTMTIMAAVAQQERARIRERSRGAVLRLRSLGKVTQSIPPLGYLRDPETRHFVVDPAWAPTVRRMFELAATRSLRDVRRIVEANGPVRGSDPAGLRRRLGSRVYLGETELPSGEVLLTHEPLVDRELFEAVQRALTIRSVGGRRPGVSSRSDVFLLRGLALCPECGHVLHSDTGVEGKRKHPGYYRCAYRPPACTSRVLARQADVDVEAERRVLEQLERLRDRLSRPSRKAAPVTDWAAARARVLTRRGRLVEAIAEGVLTLRDARVKLAECDAELARIEADERADARPTEVQTAAKLAEVSRVREAWGRLTYDERRAVIRDLTDRITISRKDAPRWTRDAWDLTMEWKTCTSRCA